MSEPDVLFFFDRRLPELELFEALEARLTAAIGAHELRVQKTQISLYKRRMFGCVSFLPARPKAERPAHWITLSFGLNRRAESPRIAAAVEAAPMRWTHHVLLSDAAQIDDELIGWLREAAAFSAAKR